MTSIYMAPLQGFTDFIYRKVYHEYFPDVDAFFIPYISVKNGKVLQKYIKEILPENNTQKRVVPQVLVRDAEEIRYLATVLQDYGYTEINLNMGCPYPMVTNRGRGAGLLNQIKTIDAILNEFFKHFNLHLSVKTRLGLELPSEFQNVIPVFNQYPLKEVILHPRVAKQLYNGEINSDAFLYAKSQLNHDVVYNGDIVTAQDFHNRQSEFPSTPGFMLGRGLLMNCFLPAESKKITIGDAERIVLLQRFHERIFDGYSNAMDNPGNALNKLKQFWIYFRYNFAEPERVWKNIKKTKKLHQLKTETTSLFAL